MNEIIIDKKEEIVNVFLLEDNKIVEYDSYNLRKMPKIGNIYKGKIKKIEKDISSLFIDYGEKKCGFVTLKDISKYKVGDVTLCVLKKEETNQKGAKLSLNLSNYCIKEMEKLLLLSKNIDKGIVIDNNSLEKNIFEKTFIINETERIWVNDANLYENINTYISINLKEISFDMVKLKIVDSLIYEFGLLTQFEKINNNKIWLKDGGQIVIDKTEALTAIDVNSKKFSSKDINVEDNIFKINLQAAKEIMKQVRLKNIKGIIIVDFINMKSNENREALIIAMKELAVKDRLNNNFFGFTKLGLLEFTRS